MEIYYKLPIMIFITRNVDKYNEVIKNYKACNS